MSRSQKVGVGTEVGGCTAANHVTVYQPPVSGRQGLGVEVCACPSRLVLPPPVSGQSRSQKVGVGTEVGGWTAANHVTVYQPPVSDRQGPGVEVCACPSHLVLPPPVSGQSRSQKVGVGTEMGGWTAADHVTLYQPSVSDRQGRTLSVSPLPSPALPCPRSPPPHAAGRKQWPHFGSPPPQAAPGTPRADRTSPHRPAVRSGRWQG